MAAPIGSLEGDDGFDYVLRHCPGNEPCSGRVRLWRRFNETRSQMQVEIVVKPTSSNVTQCMHKYIVCAFLTVLSVSLFHWMLVEYFALDSRLQTFFFTIEIILLTSIVVIGLFLCCILFAKGFKLEFRWLHPEPDGAGEGQGVRAGGGEHPNLQGEDCQPTELRVQLPLEHQSHQRYLDFPPPSYEEALNYPVPKQFPPPFELLKN